MRIHVVHNVRPSLAFLRAGAFAVQLLLPVVAVVGTLCGAGSCLSADDAPVVRLKPELSLDQYRYREWSMQDGLPSDQVHDILQTRDGYLWLATERGLARFDGLEFAIFNRFNTHEFVTNQTTTLYESRDGILWVGTHRGGLISCRPGHPPEFQRFAELENYVVQCLCEDSDGDLWVGTEVGTWALSEGECAPKPEAPLNVMAMCQDDNGQLWLGASIWGVSRPESAPSPDIQPQPGLYRVVDGRFSGLTQADGFPQTEMESSVRSLCPDRTGGLWIGTAGESLLHYQNGKCENHAAAVGLQARQYHNVHHDRAGQLWISTLTAGLQRLSGGIPERLPASRRQPMVRCIAEDRDGNIWFGGSHRGLRCISNPELAQVNLGFRPASLRCVLEDSAGDLWFGSGSPAARNNSQMGLHRLRNGAVENFGTDDALPTPLVTALAEGPGHLLWIGTHNGLVRRSDSRLTTFTTDDGLGRNWIRAVHADRAGVIWIGFWEGGLQRMHEGTFTTVAEFSDADVNWFHEHSSGVLWIGSNRGLFRWLDDRLERVRDNVLDGLPTINFTACFEDQEGDLWFGTDGGGLCRCATGQYSNWTSEQGLWEDVIYAIQEDSRGHFWLGGAHGLTSLPRHSLDALEAGTADRLEVRVQALDVGARFGPDYRPNVALRNDGSIWFVTTAGAVVLDSSGPYQNPLPPIVHVGEVRVDGESVDFNSAVTTLAGFRRVEFHYTANTLAAPERVRFRYQLDGWDEHWIDAGHQRSTSYTGLPPGEYIFRLTADNGHGVWNETGARVGLTVLPRWFETGWFRMVLAIGLIGLTVVLLQRYTAGIRRRNAVLSEREARFRSMADSSPMLIWTSGPDRGCTYFNTTWLEFTGRPLEAELGDGWAEGVHPDDLERCVATYHAAFDRRESFEMSYRLRQHDREYRWVLDCGGPRFEPDGSFAGYVGSGFDITERRQAREALQESEQRYETASRVAHFGYWYRSLEDDAASWSEEMYRIFGVDPESFEPSLEEVMGRFHPDDREKVRNALELARTGGKPFDVESRIQHADGSERTVHSVAEVVVSDETGEVVALTGIMQDITARRRAEDDAQSNRDQLIRVGRAASMGEVTATIAHEVKQPLFAIVSNAQTARRLLDLEQPDVDEVRDALDDIANDGNRASNIIDHVRSLVTKQHRPTDQLNLNDVLRDTIRLAEPEIRKRGLVIETGFARELPPVQGDPIELQQVILNLLINGAQAMSEFESGLRELAVRTSADNGSVELAVEDHGSGLADAEIGRLFQPFYTTKPEGTGMGLAISRTIIEAHGGRIWATRNTDCGMTFHFSLPARQDIAS